MLMIQAVSTLVIGLALLASPGCTLRGTTNEITDTTDNITVSTSGRTWFDEEGLIKPDHKIIAFISLNRANLEQDVARGRGEYLSSLESLLGMDAEAESRFGAHAQQGLESLLSADAASRVRQFRDWSK